MNREKLLLPSLNTVLSPGSAIQSGIELEGEKMPANILTDYGLKDLEESLIPSRSRLYHLEPIGIGTPFVESLTSYIVRLAHAHCVEPRILVIHEILPYLKKLGWPGSKKPRLLAINGIGSLASHWVRAVEELTLRRNL